VTPDQAGTGTNTPYPPLDSEWDNASVTVFSEVTDPDQNADDVAGNDNVDLLANNTGTPGSGGLTTPNGTQQTIYVNHPQTCTIRCSDGSPFSYTVPTGTFRGYSQASVDRSAYNLACKRAAQFRVCLGNISSRACVGTAFNQTVTVDSASSPFVFEVTGGSLPSWATATVGDKTFNITGTPTSADVGTTIFTLFAQDLQGFSMTKDYTIIVMGVTSSTTLPAFTQNVAYSSQVTISGGTAPYTLTILSGNLPPGLTMDDEGLISGTPTVTIGLYPVFVGITDSAGGTCTETLAFDTTSACVPLIAPALDASYGIATGQSVFCNLTGTIFSVNGTDVKNLVETSTSGTILNAFSIGADAIGMIFYENVHQKIYVGYTVGVLQKVASIDPLTRTISNSTTLSGVDRPQFAAYDNDNDKLWVGDAVDRLYVINPVSLAFTTLIGTVNFTVGPDHFQPTGGIVYISALGIVASFGSYFSPGATFGMARIDAVTLVPVVTDFGTPDTTSDCCYCPDTNRIFVAAAPGSTVYVINPSTPDLATTVALTASTYTPIWNPCTSRIEVLCASGANVITMHYINPNTLVVTGSVLIAPTLHQFNPSLLWYDSVNARVWCGTRTALLKFT
jgi:hypothetical protein